ncbi:NAD(P)-binding protein [Cucurbitaria berberidis CBS 394.84]|uniref:NAD(P)-binding protein n=1 Tax=Cucurbitaria berberidis CBS 394.84 TaxID=1168544 RepID=A0A9P4GKP6_9PLEO|nr:NAD(P)-binding protein [Cucurbitaria berberidis CBS 394.84]KAF1847365.1 NAD(P)-binding protein [Cucurbitaria berberidis CBS 394.84]
MSNLDWGSSGAPSFTKIIFSDVYPAIDPSNTTLPTGFSVCIIGASRGIGAGIATSYAKAGASLIILAGRRTSGLEDVAQQCKQTGKAKDIQVLVIRCDLTIPSDVEFLAAQTRESYPSGLDVLALNSGVTEFVAKIVDTPTDQIINTTAVNYVGTFLVAKNFVPLLLAKDKGAKMFAVVGSMASLLVRGPIANAQYCVSKTAQLRLAELLHEEFHVAHGLRVFCAHPGAVASEQSNAKSPDEFKSYLTDSAELCGAFFVWLSTRGEEVAWLSGRLLSAKWDVVELERRRDEIVANDLLKLKLVL